MKKIIAIACGLLSLVVINAQDKKWDKENKIEGSGKLVTKDISIQPFDQLDVSGVYQLVLKQDGKEALKIEADDNLQELFEVKNEGSKLTIKTREHTNYQTKNKVKVYLSFKQIKSMNLKIVGNVTSEGNLNFGSLSWDNKSVGSVTLAFNAQKLDLDNKSVGNVNLSGKVDDAVINNKGVGSLKATDLVVQTMDINNEGVGGAEVNAVKEIKVKDSFLGKVKNVGAAIIKKKVVI